MFFSIWIFAFGNAEKQICILQETVADHKGVHPAIRPDRRIRPVWIFLLTGIMVTIIAVVSVTWQTLIAASRNPVDAIWYE